MAVTKIVNCDACGRIIKDDEHWDSKPTTISIGMTSPAQSYESYEFGEVCGQCRKLFHTYIDKWRQDVKEATK